MKLLCFLYVGCMSLSVLHAVSAKPLTTEKILFSSDRSGNWDIYMMNPDGSQQVRLTEHRANDLRPVCSPTGTEILFVSNRSGIRDLYTMRPDGQAERPVFPIAKAYRMHPAWSIDGRKIAYSQHDFAGNNATVYTAKADGTSVTPIVEIKSSEGGDPVWSPDGTELAFVVHGEIHWASRQIRFINLKTRKQETLLPEGTPRMWQPAWTATSNKIAFVWNRPEHRQQSIFTVNRDGSGLQQIVDVRANTPAWSPTGDELAYSQGTGDKSQIFKINLVTRGTTQLTHEGNNFLGSWFDPSVLPVAPQPQLLTTTWSALKSQD